jgi:hypothetical protein
MMSEVGAFMISEVVRLLEDGRWHPLSEIKENFCFSEDDLARILCFLKRFGLTALDEQGKAARLDKCLLELPV